MSTRSQQACYSHRRKEISRGITGFSSDQAVRDPKQYNSRSLIRGQKAATKNVIKAVEKTCDFGTSSNERSEIIASNRRNEKNKNGKGFQFVVAGRGNSTEHKRNKNSTKRTFSSNDSARDTSSKNRKEGKGGSSEIESEKYEQKGQVRQEVEDGELKKKAKNKKRQHRARGCRGRGSRRNRSMQRAIERAARTLQSEENSNSSMIVYRQSDSVETISRQNSCGEQEENHSLHSNRNWNIPRSHDKTLLREQKSDVYLETVRENLHRNDEDFSFDFREYATAMRSNDSCAPKNCTQAKDSSGAIAPTDVARHLGGCSTMGESKGATGRPLLSGISNHIAFQSASSIVSTSSGSSAEWAEEIDNLNENLQCQKEVFQTGTMQRGTERTLRSEVNVASSNDRRDVHPDQSLRCCDGVCAVSVPLRLLDSDTTRYTMRIPLVKHPVQSSICHTQSTPHAPESDYAKDSYLLSTQYTVLPTLNEFPRLQASQVSNFTLKNNSTVSSQGNLFSSKAGEYANSVPRERSQARVDEKKDASTTCNEGLLTSATATPGKELENCKKDFFVDSDKNDQKCNGSTRYCDARDRPALATTLSITLCNDGKSSHEGHYFGNSQNEFQYHRATSSQQKNSQLCSRSTTTKSSNERPKFLVCREESIGRRVAHQNADKPPHRRTKSAGTVRKYREEPTPDKGSLFQISPRSFLMGRRKKRRTMEGDEFDEILNILQGEHQTETILAGQFGVDENLRGWF